MKKIKSSIPVTATRIPLRPLALGEKTGHMHRLITDGSVAVDDACEMYDLGEGKFSLRVTEEGVSLIHATKDSDVTCDHHPQVIPPGEYRIVIQEENSDFGNRQVLD